MLFNFNFRVFTNIAYYGLALNSSEFGGDRFLNCFLAGITELPAVLISYWLMEKAGRPFATAITMSIGGVFCIISPLVRPGILT